MDYQRVDSQGDAREVPEQLGRVPSVLSAAMMVGQVAMWLVPSALTSLFWVWLLFPDSAGRNLFLLTCAIIPLAVSCLALVLRAVASQPSQRRVRQLVASRTGRAENAVAFSKGVPGQIASNSSWVLRTLLTGYTAICAVLLLVALGVGNLADDQQVAAMKESGVETSWLPVTAVKDVEEVRHRSGGTAYEAVVEVRPPWSDGTGSEKGPAAFSAEFGEFPEEGQKVYVAFAPARPDLGVLGDNETKFLDRKLQARALSIGWTWALGIVWFAGVALLTAITLLDGGGQRAKRLQGDENFVRARTVGHGRRDGEGVHVTLETNVGEIALFVTVSPRQLAEAAEAQDGWLVWHPDRSRKRKNGSTQRIAVNFVADAGWQISGELTEGEASSAGAAVGPRPGVDGTARSVELIPAKGWMLAGPSWMAGVVTLCSLTAFAMLWLPLPDWRLMLGIAAPVALTAGFIGLAVSNAKAPEPGVTAGNPSVSRPLS